MIKPFGFACRRAGVGACITALLLFLFTAIAVTTTGPRAAPERVDACKAYAVYAEAGSGDSGLAKGMRRVCAAVGPVPLTQACMTYHTRISDPDFPPDDELMLKLAVDCENSMPGGTVIAAPEKPAPGTGWNTTLECGTGLECRPEPDDPTPVSPDEVATVTAGDPPVSDGADMAGPPLPARECGAGLECRPQPDDPQPEDEAAVNIAAPTANSPVVAAAAPVAEEAGALELAFWEAIVDGNDPDLFSAYLDKFPDGTFVPIAKARISALRAADPVPAVDPPPVLDGAEAALEVPLSPEELYVAAQAILDDAYQRPVSEWNEAIGPAIAFLVEAGAGGFAPAYVELGGLAENGLGMPTDVDKALGYFIEAGQMGALEGYYRALMLYDQFGRDADYVETFLTLCRIAPDMALESLDAVGRNGPKALQRRLKAEGYYTGRIDGAFGAGSRAALAAYVGGAPPAAQSAPPSSGPSSPPADGLAVELQMALQRVGCYFGSVDGRWGPASSDAMAAFNRWNGSHFPTQQPSVQALNGVARTPGQICGVD